MIMYFIYHLLDVKLLRSMVFSEQYEFLLNQIMLPLPQSSKYFIELLIKGDLVVASITQFFTEECYWPFLLK